MKHCFQILILCAVLLLTTCGRNDTAQEVTLADHIPDTATKMELQNCHNGRYTFLSDPDDIAQITDFLRSVTGTDAESGKGYYEGSYYIAFYQGEEKIFSMAFGDSDSLYMGEYGDGYPIRYRLKDITIQDDVIPFFSQFDSSGFQWN